MDQSEQLAALADLAESLGLEIRRAPASEGGGHPGGALVRLKGKEILFLDESAPIAERVQVLAAALAGRKELASMFVPPALRELLGEAAGE